MTHPNHRICRVVVLGSTGSIGVNTLAVIHHLNNTTNTPLASRTHTQYKIVGLAAGSQSDLLFAQATAHNVPKIALTNCNTNTNSIPDGVTCFTGSDACAQLIEEIDKVDLVVAAVVGSAGLPSVVAAIKRGCDIALANKETLVAAGSVIIPLIHHHQVRILPIDSEHSAIFQALQSRSDLLLPHANTNSFGAFTYDTLPALSQLNKIILTASGGPFRTWNHKKIQAATVAEALNHPTWTMGPKITIDSASMANKALEMIEAHWLFGLPHNQIDVIIHPQSLIHGMVEYMDGSVIAQLGPPDMCAPIQYALTYPDRPSGCTQNMHWDQLQTLEFEQPDISRFPMLKLAQIVIESGQSSGAILNAANEFAVAAFLNKQIPFGQIAAIAETALDRIAMHPLSSLADVMAIDAETRAFCKTLIP